MADHNDVTDFSGHGNSGFQIGRNHGPIYHITNIYHAGASSTDQGSGGVQNSLPGPSPKMPARMASGDRPPMPAPKVENIERHSRQRFSVNRLVSKGAERPSLQELANLSDPYCPTQLRIRQRTSEDIIADTSQRITSRSQNHKTHSPLPTLPTRVLRHESRSVSDNLSSLSEEESLETLLVRAQILENKKDYVAAEAMYRKALMRDEEKLGEEHPDTLTSAAWLAWVLKKLSRYEEAERFYRRAWVGRERVLGKEHPHTLRSMNGLGLILGIQEKYEEAEELCRRAWVEREKVHGKEHLSTLRSMDNLAWVLGERDKYEQGENMCREEASEIVESINGSSVTCVSLLEQRLSFSR